MSERIQYNKESNAGGWFLCQSGCGMYILLDGLVFRRAEQMRKNKELIICRVCDPVNGLDYTKRTDGKMELTPGAPEWG